MPSTGKPSSSASVAILIGFISDIRCSEIAFCACFIFWFISLWDGRVISIMVSIDTFVKRNFMGHLVA